MAMIITLSGSPGSGKSSVAKVLAKKLGYRHLSAGGIQRLMGKERGMSIHQWDRYVELHPEIDNRIEQRLLAEAKKARNAVMDWRLGFHFLPKCPKIFLYVKPSIGARRIFNAHRSSEAENATLQKTKANMLERHSKLVRRLKKVYGIDYSDQKNFDFVIDTSALTIDETVNTILKFLKRSNRKV